MAHLHGEIRHATAEPSIGGIRTAHRTNSSRLEDRLELHLRLLFLRLGHAAVIPPIRPWTAVQLLGGSRLMVGGNPVIQGKEEDGEMCIPILLSVVQSLCKRDGVTRARMCPDTPVWRKRMVALVFGAVEDLKATCPHTTPGDGDKVRGQGDTMLRALLKATVGTRGHLL